MGKVMGWLAPKTKGRADGRRREPGRRPGPRDAAAGCRRRVSATTVDTPAVNDSVLDAEPRASRLPSRRELLRLGVAAAR